MKCGTDWTPDSWRRGMCRKCYHKFYLNPRWRPIVNPRRINPKGGGHIALKENPRKGKCEWCHRKIGDEYTNTQGKIARIKYTNIHHLEYHKDPLKDTIELCNPCHSKESARLRQDRDSKTGRFLG